MVPCGVSDRPSSIPLIDARPLLSGASETAREIDRACRETGFFYLTGHPVDEATVSSVSPVVKPGRSTVYV